MAKWYEILGLKPHENLIEVMENIEEILSRKGTLRILSLFAYTKSRNFQIFNAIRFTAIKENTKLRDATLNKALNLLKSKNLIIKIYKDITEPRNEKNVVHYELTNDGKTFVNYVINGRITDLYESRRRISKLKKLLK